jgi:hypothetical protein
MHNACFLTNNPIGFVLKHLEKGKRRGKDKGIHVMAWINPEFSRRMRLPDFKTIGT